jgi:hypothetical protein
MKRKVHVDENVERCRQARRSLRARFGSLAEMGEFLAAEDKRRLTGRAIRVKRSELQKSKSSKETPAKRMRHSH